MFESDRTLMLNEDKSEVVEETDPAAAFQLVHAGSRIPISEAIRYGLVTGDSIKGFKIAKGYDGTLVASDQPFVLRLGNA